MVTAHIIAKQTYGLEHQFPLNYSFISIILKCALTNEQNAMVSSIVQVTNLPRKRIVKWFEDRRAEDGVPQNRVPYQRSSILS